MKMRVIEDDDVILYFLMMPKSTVTRTFFVEKEGLNILKPQWTYSVTGMKEGVQ